MAIVEENFPRGGKAKVEKKGRPAHERKKKTDSLFKNSAIKKNKRRINKKKFDKQIKSDKREQLTLTKKEKKTIEKEKTMLDTIEPLTFKMLSEGMKVLSRIQEVREMDLLLSLPGRIQAVVPITNISTPYSNLLNKLAQDEDVEAKGLKEMLKEGELFPCCIKEVTNDGSFKVTASLNPADVNSDIPLTALNKGMKITAAVQSVEDHGFVMDIGIPNVRSFLAKAADQQFAVGQIISVCVTGCQIDGHVATLTVSTEETFKFKQNVELNIATLVPATKLHVTVSKVCPQGLTVTFGNLVGYIHRDHLVNTTDTVASYEKSATFTAMVMYTLPLVNAVYFSLKSSIIKTAKTNANEAFPVGRILDSTVTESTSAGLFVQFSKKAKGFIPLRHLSDTQEVFEDIKALFPIKSHKRCRILSHASLDDIYICTLKKSLLEQKAIRYEDFIIGDLLEGKIDSVTPAGISLNLGVNLKGFIPKLHWADDPRLKKPELRFRVGEPLSCRVLKVMIERKTVHLTCKKTLLDESILAYAHPSQLKKNLNLKGTVALIEKGGILVAFFGELTGWMPRDRLLKKGISDISRFFYVGQLVDCTVESVHETGKVTLNLAKSDTDQSENSVSKPAQSLGTLVKCRVERVFEAGPDGTCGLEVSIPDLKITGFIPIEHLSDFPKIALQLLSCYRSGDIIEEAVVWLSSKLQTVLTLKPTIINFVKENHFPSSLEEIAINSIFPCVSTRHKPFGVFATLLSPPTKFDVLFPTSKLPPQLYSFLEKDAQHLTMEGKVIKVDKEEKKISVSLVSGADSQNPAELMAAFLLEEEKIKAHLMNGPDERLKSLASMKLGDVVVGKLLTEFDSTEDLEFELPHGVKGIVPTYHHAAKSFKKNDLVVGSVLHSDPIRQVVYVTTRADVITRLTGLTTFQAKGKKQKARILLNTDYFSLVSVVNGKSKSVAFTPNLRGIKDLSSLLPSPFQVGSDVNVVIDSDKLGRIATYHKTPQSWASLHSRLTKRAASSDDGPSNKKTKKGLQADEKMPNGDEIPATTTGNTTQKEKNAQQVTAINGQEEVVKSAETCSVLNKSADKKQTKDGKNSQGELVKESKKKEKAQPAQKSMEAASSAQGVNKQPTDNKKKTSLTKRKEQVIGPAQDTTRTNQVTNGKRSQTTVAEDDNEPCPDEKKDLSPWKKRRVDQAPKQGRLNPLDLPRLSIASAFKWDDDMTSLPLSSAVADSSDSEDEDENQDKVVVKDRRERARQKLEQAKKDEAKLSKIEEDLNNPDRVPVTTDDFDRMVLASPNSSILWVQYMALHLENAEIEKARTVAQRALKIISFREEQEKFNVWIAWLNLEHMYGTTEGYEQTLQEALRYNEPFKVHRQMALNLEQSGKFDEAESLYTTMLKKYKQNKSVWMNACLFYVRNSKLDTARGVFQRALSVLDKKEHIDLISRFAQLEMKFGQLGRGKTLFDTLLMSYPKRTDLWLVYIDTLTKVDDIESARQVLERCITLQLPAKKMKSIFQKFLEFETHHGDEERQDYVRKKALDYVESKSGATDE